MGIPSRRLAAVAACLSRGEAVADIGADHAQLSLYLIRENIAPRVIIGELADRPYQRACQAAANSDCPDKLEIRQGSGLQVLESGEVDTIVLAGLGGDTIVAILAESLTKACSFRRYVFQPMSKPGVLRRWLADQGWIITDERLIPENRHLFVVLSSQPGHSPYQLTDLEYELGPFILKADEEIKRRYIREQIHKYRRIEQNLRSAQPCQSSGVPEYRDKIRRLEGILNASQSQ